MPVIDSNTESDDKLLKGDLYITFDIRFPRNLTEDQRKRIENVLISDS